MLVYLSFIDKNSHSCLMVDSLKSIFDSPGKIFNILKMYHLNQYKSSEVSSTAVKTSLQLTMFELCAMKCETLQERKSTLTIAPTSPFSPFSPGGPGKPCIGEKHSSIQRIKDHVKHFKAVSKKNPQTAV